MHTHMQNFTSKQASKHMISCSNMNLVVAANAILSLPATKHAIYIAATPVRCRPIPDLKFQEQ